MANKILNEKEKRSILRSVRLSPTIDKHIQIIADYEDRTISKTIERLVMRGLVNYIVYASDDFLKVLNEKKTEIDAVFIDELRKNGELLTPEKLFMIDKKRSCESS